jgi:hypothetical protein
MDICSTKIETNYYDSDESDCEFMESVQLQLTKSGWYDDFNPDLSYYKFSCSALKFEWIQSSNNFYPEIPKIPEALKLLKYRLFDDQQYESFNEKMTFLQAIGEEVDFESKKKEFEYFAKNRNKIISLLVSYKLLKIKLL